VHSKKSDEFFKYEVQLLKKVTEIFVCVSIEVVELHEDQKLK